MDNWIQKVLTKWQTEGVKLNPPATIAGIERAEAVLNFKFPPDFKIFYLQANGFEGLDWQEHMFTLWPLEMIIEEYNDDTNKNFIGFCDFLLASHFIGFNKNRTGVFKSNVYPEDGEFIAQTFEDVVGMINSNNDLIY